MTLEWPHAPARAAVEDVARTPRLLVALDFDGTLAPLVDDPMNARATPAAVEVVARLAAVPGTTVAFVSGRSMRDLRVIAEHSDDSPVYLAGSHGVEFWTPGEGEAPSDDDEAAHRLRDELRHAAEAATAHLPGVWIEPKTFGFGVPTRLASAEDERSAFEIVDHLVRARAPHWRRRTGHNIVEYSFRHEGKDSAVAVLRERLAATAVIFAGDDVTDEDALRALRPADLGIRVGVGETAARVRVADTAALVEVLTAVAAARASTPAPPRTPRGETRE